MVAAAGEYQTGSGIGGESKLLVTCASPATVSRWEDG